MSSIVTKRFVECHNHLKNQGVIRSSRQFALALEYAPQSLSDILKGKRDVPLEIIRKSIKLFDFNPRYLFTGDGPMTGDASAVRPEPVLSVVTNQELEERIAYVPVAAQAGYGNQLYDPEYMKELPTFSLPGHKFASGTHRCFDISGDSMEPTLYTGDQIVCDFVERDHWETGIRDNYVYVIVTPSSVVVKRVINKLKTEGHLELISDNSFYEPYTVEWSEIKEIWKVAVKISPFMPSPSNVRNALHEEIDTLKETIHQQSASIKMLNSTLELLLKKSRNHSA